MLSLSQLGLITVMRLATTTALASWVSSPMSWSSDGEWLAYTAATSVEAEDFRPGSILLTSEGGKETAAARSRDGQETGGAACTYRIWATHRSHQPSVLIEESPWPLSAPTWSPRGKSVAFGRFVPQSNEPGQALQRGRYEVVIQDGLDRKRVVWSSAEIGLDPAERAALAHLSCSWSPDGLYLAVPRPGARSAVELMRTDLKKHVLELDGASLPTWSPDGSKLAFVRHESRYNRLEFIERRGQAFGDPRPVGTVSSVPITPYWNSDSRSLYAVVEKSATVRSHDLEVVRFVLPGEFTRVLSLVPEPKHRGAAVRGLAIDFDREGERCFYAIDLEGHAPAVVWCSPRDRGTVHKRFHPLDLSQRIEGLSISPDGQLVAMRLGSARGLSFPVIYDTETDQTTLVVPGDLARREWLIELATSAREILESALPPAKVEGQATERPTVLPLPGELPVNDAAVQRYHRLARFGSILSARPIDRADDPAKRQQAKAFESEVRLFFSYLRGDFAVAAAALDELLPLLSSQQSRLAALSIRAQVLWGSGDRAKARGVIDFLVSVGEPNRQQVEETPTGLVFSASVTPQQAWSHYLSAREALAVDPKAALDGDFPADVFDPRLQDPAGGALPMIDRAGAPIPFAPFGPARDFP